MNTKMHDILCDMDSGICALKDIQNLFYLLNESLDEEMQDLKKNRGSASIFVDRISLFRSMINVATYNLRSVTSELESSVDLALTIHSNGKSHSFAENI